MRAHTRGRLWWAAFWVANAAVLLAFVVAARAFDASVLLPVMDAEAPIPALAWYRLDGNALDSSGNGYNGTVIDAVQTNCIYGSGYYFDGNADYINIGVPDVTSTNSTICYWTQITSETMASAGRVQIVTKSDGGYQGFSSTTQYRIQPVSTGGTLRNWTIPTITAGACIHVAVVSGADGTRVYINGVASASGAQVLGSAMGAGTLGRNFASSTACYRGSLDDVRIYTRALSTANIQRIMTGQTVEPIEELQ